MPIKQGLLFFICHQKTVRGIVQEENLRINAAENNQCQMPGKHNAALRKMAC